MFVQKLRHKVGSFLKGLSHDNRDQEIQSMKREIEVLKQSLNGGHQNSINALRHEIEMLRSNMGNSGDTEKAMLRQEMEILRNELLENVAAIHRIEILTLAQRIELLNDFGKALPPTRAGKTRDSSKPKGFSFGIITNGKRNEKLARLVETIHRQNIKPENYEILIAGCVDEIPSNLGIRKFHMEKAASEGRLGAMRNVTSTEATFNKFVCLDDDFLLHPKWADAVSEIKGDFDVATGIIVNPDLSRYCDWVNFIENATLLRSYHEMFDKCQYVTGGYGIYKDVIFREHSWNEDLGFYQGEDVSFSKRLFDAGFQLKFIPKAIVMHDDERYRQKGYGVVRLSPEAQDLDRSALCLRIETLCPRTLS